MAKTISLKGDTKLADLAYDKSVDEESTPEQREADKKLIKQAREHYKDTTAGWRDIRRDALLDQRFYTGEQYDPALAKAARQRNNSPRIQVNQLPTFVQQVENAIRQQNISIAVHATDEAGSEEKAKTLQGIVRHIEHISNAKQAYLWAAGSHGALVPGFGFIKLNTRYCKAGSFDQDVIIEGVKDPFKVIPDINAVMPDFSYAEYWFEYEDLSKESYEERFGDSVLSTNQFSDWSAIGNAIGVDWLRQNEIRLIKYWYKDTEIRHFALFEDGSQGYLDDFGIEVDEQGKHVVVDEEKHQTYPRVPDQEAIAAMASADAKEAPGSPEDTFPITEAYIPPQRLATVVRLREETQNTVCWVLTNGVEILERGEWNDSEFPFVAVVGKDEVVDGKRVISGIVRQAKDSQKMLNYFISNAVRKVGASNKAPWIAALKSIPETERQKWDTSNVEDWAILYYNDWDPATNRPIAPPQRGDAIEPAIQMLMQGAQMFDGMIKKTVGIYEAGLGEAMGDRQSGIAIDTLAQKGEQTNFHFSDNLVMSMKRLGCLVLRLIPKVYDTPRAVRIINPDDSAELVKINQSFGQNGEQKYIDMTTDENYDVVVDTGPTFATKKAEQSESLLKFLAINPQLAPLLMDLVAKGMDWDISGAVAERIEALQAQQMPWLHQLDNMDDVPPQAKSMIGQLVTQLQQANQHIQALNQGYQLEKAKNDTNAVAHASKERIEQLKAITKLSTERMKLAGQMQQSQDRLVLERTKAEIQHVQHMQQLHLDALMHADKIAGQADPELYATLRAMIEGKAPIGAPGTQAPATPPMNLVPGPGSGILAMNQPPQG
jgi:Phage P22-like portal protein